MSWTNLKDKVVIVTGGAAGIGLAVSRGFVEVGAKVMIADFAEDAGARAVEEVSRSGTGSAAFAKCDTMVVSEGSLFTFARASSFSEPATSWYPPDGDHHFRAKTLTIEPESTSDIGPQRDLGRSQTSDSQPPTCIACSASH